MGLFDVSISLTQTQTIRQIEWKHPALSDLYAEIWNGFLHQPLDALFPAFHTDREHLSWQDEHFSFAYIPTGMGAVLLLSRQTDALFLYQRALDKIAEGIQLYDKNAQVVYINKASRQLSEIPELLQLEGRHLLDLYDLDENISTVMTCLRTRAPVVNRFDAFQSTDGTQIKSTNTAYPIFRASELMGSIVFEQDTRIVAHQIDTLTRIKETLENHSTTVPAGRFHGYTLDNVIGNNPKMRQAVSMARKIAPKHGNVLLQGETGTGKEIFAQGIHRESARKDQKFVAINCAAIPDQLIEGLFFGTTKGSYTGSVDRPGYAEEANGGTLFLDELNSMSLGMQAKILRVIQEGTFRRLGSDKDIKTDLRIIASCNENPFELIAQNRLRKDLFYRLSTILIDLPPLREHIDDLELLIDYYFRQQSARYVKAMPKFQKDVLQSMRAYTWPGNVRELFHVLEHILNVIEGPEVTPEHLPKHIFTPQDTETLRQSTPHEGPAPQTYRGQTLQSLMDTYEEDVLRQALEYHGYNITQTAQQLGLRRQSLQYRIQKHNIIF